MLWYFIVLYIYHHKLQEWKERLKKHEAEEQQQQEEDSLASSSSSSPDGKQSTEIAKKTQERTFNLNEGLPYDLRGHYRFGIQPEEIEPFPLKLKEHFH